MNTCVLSNDRIPAVPRRQRGLVVVELAIALPLIVLIMFATAELGRAFFQYTTLTKAVEAGTRYYSSDQTIDPGTIRNLVVYADPQGLGDKVLPDFELGDVDVGLDGGGEHVVVTATYTFQPFLGGELPIIGKIDGFTMTASHEMRAL